MNKKLSLVGCVFTILLILLVLRIIWLKTVHGEEYTASALSQNMIDKTVPSVRGSIYDSNGNVLAASVPVYDVILEPIILVEADETTDGKASENTVGVLSEILDIQKSELNSYLEKKQRRIDGIQKRARIHKNGHIRGYLRHYERLSSVRCGVRHGKESRCRRI